MAPTLSTVRLFALLPLFLASASARPRRSCKPASSASATLSSTVSVYTLPASSSDVSISVSTDVVSVSTSSDVDSSATSSSATTESDTSTTSLFVSSSISTDSSVEATTTTTTEAPSSSSSMPSSTAPPTSSTAEGPAMTTITSCPPTPTVAGPAQCYKDNLPANCERLNTIRANFYSRGMSMSLRSCQVNLNSYGYASNPTASACFPRTTATNPENAAAATSTLASVYSCLRTAHVLCSFNADCQTRTYPVGQVPEPTPSIGVDLLYDGGFESGVYGNWSVPQNPNTPTELSTLTPRTGNWGFHARYANINGASLTLARTVLGLEPGRQYRLRAWVRHDNPAATTSFYIHAYPGGGATPEAEASLQTLPANTWSERILTFTAVSSWVQVQINPRGIVLGVTNTPGGVDNIWVDDVTLTRLD